MTFPYIARIIIVLFVIIIANRLSKNLIVSILSGTVVLAFFLGITIRSAAKISFIRITSLNTIMLCITVFLIIMFSVLMKETGIMDDLVENVKMWLPKKATMAVLPAIIGLLPMPGGAVFSAPMVESCDHDKSNDPALLSEINYWFRHIWEPWWPLYPGVLLAVEITGVPIFHFSISHLVLSVACILGGYLFLLKRVKSENSIHVFPTGNQIFEFLKLVMPIFIVVIVFAVIKLLIPFIAEVSSYLPIIIGILFSQMIIVIYKKPEILSVINKSVTKKNIGLIVLVLLISVYSEFLKIPLSDGMFLMEHVRNELLDFSIPIYAVVILLPFISGLSMGISIGLVGASFPVIAGIIPPDISLNAKMVYITLAWGAGYAGMILSPVHVCLIVSSSYFKSNMTASLVKIIPPALVVFITSVILAVFRLKILH